MASMWVKEERKTGWGLKKDLKKKRWTWGEVGSKVRDRQYCNESDATLSAVSIRLK